MKLPDLPVQPCLDALKVALAERGGAVLRAPPGSGKTTVVPLALLDEAWLAGQRIVVLEPRRLAARLAAERMASLLAEPVGERVGYRIRFDTKVSPRTRIEVVTEGLLVRRLQSDPELSGVGALIFDEVHERNLDTDLALALSLDARDSLRPDLRLLAMSATLAGPGLTEILGPPGHPVPLIEADGRQHPVAVLYRGTFASRGLNVSAVASAIEAALAEHTGDILVFLPGVAEIRRVQERIQVAGDALEVWPLHGNLPAAEQSRALVPSRGAGRKVVLATNVAESSVTIEGISVVIDTGLARVPRFDPNSGLSRLVTTRISKASAVQRAGRAGRLGPGYCYRLWGEHEHPSLPDEALPELVDADLSPLLLSLAQWGVAEPAELNWLDPPPAANVRQARSLLRHLGALDGQGRLTAQGRRMSELPTHPRLASMLVRANEAGPRSDQFALACDLAGLIEERDPLIGESRFDTDIDARLQALRAFRDRPKAGAARSGDRGGDRGPDRNIDWSACRRVARAARQLIERGQNRPRAAVPTETSTHPSGKAVGPMSSGVLLSFAFPDRIAARRANQAGRFLLANGRGAHLREEDGLAQAAFLVATNLNAAGADARIHLAAELAGADLLDWHADAIESETRIEWDAGSRAVVAVAQRRLGALTLSREPLPDLAAHREAVIDAMVVGIRQMGLESLPWTEAARSFQSRVASLGQWRPKEGWPDLSDANLLEQLEVWLAPFLGGVTRRDHLSRIDLLAALKSLLDWPLHGQLDALAPTHLEIPSGRRVALTYGDGEPPIVAARLQEFFGLEETPAVAGGQIPVVLHLLSPAGRPVQVTSDIGGFWRGSYREVKRELKGRYPKHYWPDDPLNAAASTRIRPPPP